MFVSLSSLCPSFLIGRFSAVASTFIVNMQPELQPNPNE